MLLIFFILLLITCILAIKYAPYQWDDWAEVGIFASISGIVLITPMACVIKDDVEIDREVRSQPIYSLRVGEKGFYLGAGRTGSSLDYYYYTKTTKGFLLKSYYATATILQESNETPMESREFIKVRTSYWIIPFKWTKERPDTTLVLRVPENTVIKDFKTE